jgi:hypothetical protein
VAKKKHALLVTLRPEGEGFVISLDDAEVGPDNTLTRSNHVTRKEFSKDQLETSTFDEKELADFGYYVIARLNAYRELGEI